MSTPKDILKTPIEFLKGVGPVRAELLNKELSIYTFGDLLSHYPFRYTDRSKIVSVSELSTSNTSVQLKGVISGFAQIGKAKGKRLIAKLKDDTGTIELVWFKGTRWIQEVIQPGKEYLVFGKPTRFSGKVNIVHPEVDAITPGQNTEKGMFTPVYPSTEKLRNRGLNNKALMRLTESLLRIIQEKDVVDFLPEDIRKKLGFDSRFESLKNLHFPLDQEACNRATNRIKFEEFFLVQMGFLLSKHIRIEQSVGQVFEHVGDFFNSFYKESLTFDLTEAQKRVLKEIRRDVLSGKQMNRLVQGDVGSGKTVVALMSMLIAIDNGFQACLMAPTEILAQQHYNALSEQLSKSGVSIALLTGSTKTADRNQIHKALISGNLNILIGTHALIEDKVQFKNLGLAVIDEQHRFGVAQRAKLWKKNEIPPHVLVMTATPIPRTLAMTVYGDLDVSVIDELPPGRKPVKTIHATDADRLRVFGFVKESIAKGQQVYVVYPLIEESKSLDYKDLMDGYESISRAFPLSDYKVGVVHGRMKPADKDIEMQRFAKGETQILVATTVIEVGVNVPNASVMIIESSERFGLSQLHQLRGRVGRGHEQAFCVLMTGKKLSEEGKTRIRLMVETTDGFKLAEADLRMRGPGNIDGTRQSGIVGFKLADLIKDQHVLEEARKWAKHVVKEDVQLTAPKHQKLREELINKRMIGSSWRKIS